jgi:hypothetical protein
VVAMWSRLRDAYGANLMVASAAADLVRWESRYGWTRRGYGWVSEREISLNRPGFCGDSEPTEGWSHASTEEVSERVA